LLAYIGKVKGDYKGNVQLGKWNRVHVNVAIVSLGPLAYPVGGLGG
jgi:hypothetical protein